MDKEKFTLKSKSYCDETYETEPFLFLNKNVQLYMRLHYHTYLRYWDVALNLRYGNNFGYVIILKGKSYLKRKEARIEGFKFIEKFNIKDLDKLGEFEKKCILEK